MSSSSILRACTEAPDPHPQLSWQRDRGHSPKKIARVLGVRIRPFEAYATDLQGTARTGPDQWRSGVVLFNGSVLGLIMRSTWPTADRVSPCFAARRPFGLACCDVWRPSGSVGQLPVACKLRPLH